MLHIHTYIYTYIYIYSFIFIYSYCSFLIIIVDDIIKHAVIVPKDSPLFSGITQVIHGWLLDPRYMTYVMATISWIMLDPGEH